MDTGPRIDSYEWRGGREAMLRWGPDDGPVVVLALPLFEEANRTRAFGCAILRALAVRGVGGMLPDLPSQGESLVPTETATLADMRAAFAAVVGSGYPLAIRSGALVVGETAPAWLLTPQSGPDLVRELSRMTGTPLNGARATVAGNVLSGTLLEELAHESLDPGAGLGPGPRRGGRRLRIVRLASDPGAADRHVDGAPIWRRVEPDNDVVLARTLADDIAEWIATCVA